MTQGTESLDESLNNTSVMLPPSDEGVAAVDAKETIKNQIISFDALYRSMYKCKCGVLWKGSVASYFLNGIERTMALEKKLKNGTYESSPPTRFTITAPKRREILSITFKDRVYQRSLNDNIIYPVMTKDFIHDNCACQKGKGTDFARDRLITFLHRFYRRFGRNGYVAQCDIKGYYPNMTHEVATETFRKKLDPYSYTCAEKVLKEQYAGDVGYNPGSQMVQIVGISALNYLDHYIKEELHIKYYLRYMDDFILIHEDKECLEDSVRLIRDKLAERDFILHEQKTRVYPLTEGIDFLGFHFSLTPTGKVLMQLHSDNVRRERKKLRRMMGLVKKGERDIKKVDACYEAWKAHASKGNNFKLIQRMDAYYKQLKEEVSNVCIETRFCEGQTDRADDSTD